MSVIITQSAVIGPFKAITVLPDRLRCDGTDYPFSVIGGHTISEDDTLAPAPSPSMPALADYISAMEAHYDAAAQAQRYDNRITCALRAGYPGPFQPEGTAFAVWMDTCNAQGYQIMAEVEAGTRPQPTIDELLALLPVLVWPV